MSFGTTVRFEFAEKGQPSVFWQKDTQSRKTRKFGYKNKELRYPLRRKDEKDFSSVEPHSSQTVIGEKSQKSKEASKPKTDFIKKNRAQFTEPKHISSYPTAGTVTLTQDQLNAILTSVGKLTSSKENQLRISFDKDEITIESPDKEKYEDKDAKVKNEDGQEEKSIFSLVEKENLINSETKSKDGYDKEDSKIHVNESTKPDLHQTEKQMNEIKADNAGDTQHSKQSDLNYSLPQLLPRTHMTVAERKRLQWAREKAEISDAYNPWGRPGAGAPIRNRDGEVLSDYKIRQESLQKSLEEMQRKYETAFHMQTTQSETVGATTNSVTNSKPSLEPLSSTNGSVSTSQAAHGPQGVPHAAMTHMIIGQSSPNQDQVLSAKDEERKRWLEELNRQRDEKRLQKAKEQERERAEVARGWEDHFSRDRKPAHLPEQATVTGNVKESSTYANATMQEQAAEPEKTVRLSLDKRELPAAMRSSFVIGQVAPNENIFKNSKVEENKRWLAELEKQMEEKRMQKVLEEEKRKTEQAVDTWADRFSDKPDILPRQTEVQNMVRISSAPDAVTSSVEVKDQDTTFLRGQNVYIDPMTRAELDEKRQRHLAHQAAIKAQIEEKQQLREQELKRKRQEEMEEEAKLKRERDLLQSQFDQEQRKLKEKEEARQSQINHLKAVMDEAQERANQEKMIRRMQTLQKGGHDISHLKANYEALTPRFKVVEPSHIPGLTPREKENPLPGISHHISTVTHLNEAGLTSVEHDAYTENRVLTPSRFRHPSVPRTDPMSPKREFGTQTDTYLDSLVRENPPRKGSDVEIEYYPNHEDVKGGKRAKRRSTAVQDGHTQNKPTKTGPENSKMKRGWNYHNIKNQRPVKQSERDPFYERKKRESEARRLKRERELQALVEANMQIIPTERIRRVGEGDVEKKVQPQQNGRKLPRTETVVMTSSELLGVSRAFHNETENHRSSPGINNLFRGNSQAVRGQSESLSHNRSHESRELRLSPPVPTIRHRIGNQSSEHGLETERTDTHHTSYPITNQNHKRHSHYDDIDPMNVPDENFVPFTRTSEILDPSRATEPIQVSRENTQLAKARKAYLGSHNPADYGDRLIIYEDPQPKKANSAKDPIINPELVKNHPTARQDLILQQLSTLKQSLMQRQRELETCMSPSNFDQH